MLRDHPCRVPDLPNRLPQALSAAKRLLRRMGEGFARGDALNDAGTRSEDAFR